MLKVDILNIMGPVDHPRGDAVGRRSGPRARGSSRSPSRPSAFVWPRPSFAQSPRRWPSLSDSLEGYLRPIPEPDQLHLFPVDGVRDGGRRWSAWCSTPRGAPEADRRVNLGLGVTGLVIAFARLPGLVSATPRRRIPLLDDVRQLLFHPAGHRSSRRSGWPGSGSSGRALRLGSGQAAGRVEPAAASSGGRPCSFTGSTSSWSTG